MDDLEHQDLVKLGEDTTKMLKSQKKKHNTKSKKLLGLLDQATEKYVEMKNQHEESKSVIEDLQDRVARILQSNGELAGVMTVLISAAEDYVGNQDENITAFLERANDMINERIREESDLEAADIEENESTETPDE